MKKVLAAIALLSVSLNAMADPSTTSWTFNNSDFDSSTGDSLDNVTYVNVNGTNRLVVDGITMINDGVSMTMTGWSDSVGTNNTTGSSESELDGLVTQADLYYWGGNSGFGVVNNDENASNTGEHAIDNGGSWADNDMVLLTFNQAVTLSGLDFGWQKAYGNNHNGTANDTINFGVVAVNDADVANMNSGNTSWEDIYSESDMIKNTTAISTTESWENQYYTIPESPTTSTHWLVGLYEEMDDCVYDSFKILGVSAQVAQSSTVSVPEPKSLAIFALGLVMLARKKKLFKKA